MTFTRTRLANHRVVVKGTDKFGAVGETVLDSRQWDEINKVDKAKEAQAAFDEAFDQFYAPLNEALDRIGASLKDSDDPIGYVVVNEAVEGVPAQPRRTISLTQDSIVLRLLTEGKEDRLMWVNDSLEVLEAEATTLDDAVALVEAELGGETVETEATGQARVVNPDPTVFGS